MTTVPRADRRPGSGTGRRRPGRSPLVVGGLVLGAACVAWAGWAAFLVWPRADDHDADDSGRTVDAVVMLAGADDSRHEVARRLVADGHAPVLVVSNPDGRGEPLAWSMCHGDPIPPGVEVICVVPDPATTWGEALAVRRLAEERRWRSIDVVTNRPHTLRARETMRRTTGLDVHMRPVDRVDWARLPVHSAREAAGFVKALVLGRW